MPNRNHGEASGSQQTAATAASHHSHEPHVHYTTVHGPQNINHEPPVHPLFHPAPPFTPVVAGAIAGCVSTFVQRLTYGPGRAFAPSPLSASFTSTAAYFTTYEYLKSELGLSPLFVTQGRSACRPGDPDPRQPLCTPSNTVRYFVAAAVSGGISHLVKTFTHVKSSRVLAPAYLFHTTAQVAARVGLQFSIFEQSKNALALYAHPQTCEELNVGEVTGAATLGGAVAASVLYPLQRLFLPVKFWVLIAPPPSPLHVSSFSLRSVFTSMGLLTNTIFAPAPRPTGAVLTLRSILPKPTFTACLLRFLPACVATAVTYEFAYRVIRNRLQPGMRTNPFMIFAEKQHELLLQRRPVPEEVKPEHK